jgi:ATP-dependent protease ClpP protease subunit
MRGGRSVGAQVIFGKRGLLPSTREQPQTDSTVSSPQPDKDDASPLALRDRSAGRTHYFTQETNPSSLGFLEREIDESVESSTGEITIIITSPGGLLLPMLEFYRRLISLPVKIKTHAVGPVASAGTVLMLAGNERSADPRATFLFHPVSNHMQQRATPFQARSIERHRQLFELTLHEIYKARTQLPFETIARFGQETLVFNAQTAARYGIIDRIETLRLS